MQNSSYLNAHYYLGLSYQKMGKKDDALIQFNLLKEVAPDNQDVKNAIKSLGVKTNEPEEETEEDRSEEEAGETKEVPKSELEAIKPPLQEEN